MSEWKIGYSDGSGPEYITENDKAILALRWGCGCCKNTPNSFKDMTEAEQERARSILEAHNRLGVVLSQRDEAVRLVRGIVANRHHCYIPEEGGAEIPDETRKWTERAEAFLATVDKESKDGVR
jgi:hypothetical protein